MQTLQRFLRTWNSTDEGSGPNCLEKNSNYNTALLFIITLIFKFIENSLTHFLKCHAAYRNFFPAISLIIVFPFF